MGADCVQPLQVGFTSAPGQGGILAQREFDRRFSPHYVSLAVGHLWVGLGVMVRVRVIP